MRACTHEGPFLTQSAIPCQSPFAVDWYCRGVAAPVSALRLPIRLDYYYDYPYP